MRYIKPLGILVVLAVCCGLAGCWGSPPKRVHPDLPDSSAPDKAMELYDANHDGFLDAKELEKVPGLKAALSRLDTDHDGKISKEEIAARIKSWAGSRAGRVPFRVRVTRNGRPLAGAKVVLALEKFLGANLKSGTGTTSEIGIASISAPSSENPLVRGLSPGFYRVEITKEGEAIPARYNTQTTLGAEVSVEQSLDSTKFDLAY